MDENRTRDDSCAETVPSVVYFVQIGKRIKIGRSTNLSQRLKAFATSTCEPIEVIATIPGGKEEELRLHRAFSPTRIRREFFHYDGRMETFLETVKRDGLSAAWQYLDRTDPDKMRERREAERRARIVAERMKKSELDAYFVSLVAERKKSLGW